MLYKAERSTEKSLSSDVQVTSLECCSSESVKVTWLVNAVVNSNPIK